jgi:ribosomal biogenesis protein LAS1
MFRSAKAVAWRDWDEWRATYRLLYSANVAEILRGCARVSAWSTKQPLPIAVEVTASLQRELHGPRNVLALSLAVIRFINGVVEPFKNANLSVPISTIGASFGVPDFIIGIRHSATHGRMPTFELAALGAEQALVWLQTNYWEAQVAELESIENSFREDFLQLFLQSRDPFTDVRPALMCSFGISALVSLVLNPSQSHANVSAAFQKRVADFLQQMQRKYAHFCSAFVMEIAAEVASGNAVAAVWLDFFIEKRLAPLPDVARLLRWADPALLGGAVPERLLQVLTDGSEAPARPPEWPPTSIGNLPIGSQSLTMADDEWEFAAPLGQESPATEAAAQGPSGDAVEGQAREDLIEIW